MIYSKRNKHDKMKGAYLTPSIIWIIALSIIWIILIPSFIYAADYNIKDMEEYQSTIVNSIENQDTEINIYVDSNVINKVNGIDKVQNRIESELAYLRESLKGTFDGINLGDIRVNTKLSATKVSIKHSIDYKNSIKDINESEEIIDKFIKGNIDDNMSDYEKMKITYEFIVEKLKYGNTKDILKERNMFNGLQGKPVVCEAYAMVFNKIMDKLGYENRIVIGTAGGESHVWNLVKLNNKWYHVDATWGDKDKEGIDYKFLLMTDNQIKSEGNRKWENGHPKSRIAFSENDKLIKSNISNATDNIKDSSQPGNHSKSSLPSKGLIIFPIVILLSIIVIANLYK